MKIKANNKIYFLFLAIITGLTFLIHYEPALYSDDWFMISYNYFTSDPLINWSDKRPLFFTYFRILFELTQFNINVFYLISGLTTFLTAVFLFKIINEFPPKKSVFSFCVSLVYLLLPYDLSRTWLMNSYIHFSFLLFLLFIWLQIEFSKKNNYFYFWLGIISLSVSILMYEGQILLLAVWCIFIFFYNLKQKKKYFLLLSPLLLIFLYSIYRIFNSSNLNDTYMTQVVTDITEILKRLLEALKLLILGFTQPLREWFGFNGNLIPFFLLSFFVLCILLLIGLAGNLISKEKNLSYKEKTLKSPKMPLNTAIGFIFMLAGFFPILLLIPPNISGVCSRVNFFILPGAAYTIVSLLTAIALMFFRKENLAWVAVSFCILPLLLIGLFVQINVQKDVQRSWNEQKDIWQAVFKSLPDIQDNSYVLIYSPLDKNSMPEMADFACSSLFKERMPLVYPWDVSWGLRLLYDNITLNGDTMGPHVKHEILFEQNDIISRDNYKVPYNQIIFLKYDQESHETKIITDLQNEFSLPFPPQNYDPYKLIIPETPNINARSLVQ